MEEILFESESEQSRADVAAYLRQVADTLEAGDDITLRAGDQSVTLSPPSTAEFEVKAERESAGSGPGELSVEFELEWDEGAGDGNGGDGDLQIE